MSEAVYIDVEGAKYLPQAKAMNIRNKHVSTQTKNIKKVLQTAMKWSCVLPVRPKTIRKPFSKTTVCNKARNREHCLKTSAPAHNRKIEVLQRLNIKIMVKVISEDIPDSLPSLGNTRGGGCYNPYSSLPMILIDLKDLQSVHLPCILCLQTHDL